MFVMIGYIFMFKMVKKMQNSGLETVVGLTCPLRKLDLVIAESSAESLARYIIISIPIWITIMSKLENFEN